VENYTNVSCLIFIVQLTLLSWLHQGGLKGDTWRTRVQDYKAYQILFLKS